MEKYYWIQIQKNCDVGLAENHLDMRFCVPNRLTKEQTKKLDEEISDLICEYGEEHDDYSDIDYYSIIKSAAEKLSIVFEFFKVDYTIYV
jgi:hypothetical protein